MSSEATGVFVSTAGRHRPEYDGDGVGLAAAGPTVDQLADAGHFGHVQMSSHGGGVDLECLLPVVQRLAGTDVGKAAVLTVHHASMQPILLHGPQPLRERYLDDLLAGRVIATLAVTEPDVSSSNPRVLASKAIRDGDHWVVDAEKSCITGAEWAGLFIVLVPFVIADDRAALTAVAIPADTEGITVLPREATAGLRSVPVSAIRFDGVRVPPWQILGEIGDGLDVIGQGFRIGRIVTAAISLGAMKRCMQVMYRFAARREVATGPLIADPQVVRRMSRIASEIAAVEALLSSVTTDRDVPQDISLVLKVASSEFAYRAADDAMQMLGWRGYVDSYRVAGLMRDVRFLRIGEGPSEALLTELGARLAARSDTVYDWIADRTSNADLIARLRETVDELAVGDSVGSFHHLGWLCVWTVLQAVSAPGSVATAFIEKAWESERLLAGSVSALDDSFVLALPTYAEAVGTLDENLAMGPEMVDQTLSPLAGQARGVPIVGPERPGWQETVHGLVYAQIQRTPDAVALQGGEVTITYAELGEHADALAGRLAELGVLSGDVVGVFLSNSPHVAVASLAVEQAGAVLLILNPSHPAARVAGMLSDAGARAVIVDAVTSEILPPDAPELIAVDSIGEVAAPTVTADPDAAAYVNFTSGSTGRPKGVLSSHKAFANELLWRRDEFGIGAGDAVLQSASPGFDIFLWEIFGPLVTGGRLVFADSAQREWNPVSIVEQVRRHGITVLQIVPSQLDVLLDEPDLPECTSLRLVFCGGEPLSLATARKFAQVVPHAQLANLYGPTETAIDALFWRVDTSDQASWAPIGEPIANARLYIVDVEGDLAADGQSGELWIGGAGVAIGYIGAPALTAQKFRTDVRAPEPGARLYRTGDRVRRRPDGTVEFLGRIDRQLKVRGVRIEPGEIERVLCGHPDVAHAVVDVRDRAPGQSALIAYLIAATADKTLESESVLEHARDRLPSTMVPAAIIVLDSLPRTPSGKVDLAALPSATFDESDDDGGPLPEPLMPLARVWEETLGAPVTSADANFFSIGGHSLAALRVIMRIRDRMGVTLQMREFVRAATLAGLHQLIEEKRSHISAADNAATRGPVAVDRGEPLPLSPVQANLWYLQQLVPAMAAYNIPEAVRIRGRVDADRLKAAFAEVVGRHEALRTIFPSRQGDPVQVILPPGKVHVEHTDLGHLRADQREAAAHELITQASARPFDLFRDLPARMLVVTLAPDDHFVAWILHHIVADGWSAAGLLPAETSRAYAALADGEKLPPLAIQPVDYIRWTDVRLDAERRSELEEFWRDHLHDAPAEIDLPRDFPRPPLGRFRGARLRIAIPDADRQAVRDLAREHSATTYSVLLAAFMAWVASRGRQRDVVVGGVTAGRDHPSVENVIGNFANMVALRCTLADDPTFAELVVRARNEIRAVMDHAALSFPEVVNQVRPERVGTRNPIFQAAVTLYDGDVAPLHLEGAHVEQVLVDDGSAKFDIELGFVDDGVRLTGFLEYDSDLFSARTAQRMVAELTSAISALSVEPECTVEQYAARVRAAAARDTEPAPLTKAQRRIWLLDRLAGGGRQLCSQRYFELRGDIDAARLEQAVTLLMARHPGLATRFRETEQGVVQVVGDPPRVQMQDLRNEKAGTREQLVRQLIEADAGRPIDIAQDAPLRGMIVQVDDDRIILGMNYHHIVADFWSEATIFTELSRIYANPGRPSPSEGDRMVTMGEIGRAEVAKSPGPQYRSSLKFWDGIFDGLPARLELPTDRPQPSRPSFEGARVTLQLGDEVRSRLDAFARQAGVDRSTVVLAMWQYLLHRYTNQDSLLVGVPEPGRPPGVPSTTIGYFANLLPLRGDFPGGLTLQMHTSRTAARLAEALAHGDVSFDDLMARYGSLLPKSAQLIEVSFVPEIPGAWGPRFDGVEVSAIPHDPGRALFKLGLTVDSDPAANLHLVFDFSTALWDAATIERMAGHLATLLSSSLSQPDAALASFSMLTDAEIAELKDIDGRRDIPPAHPTLHKGFEAQAAANPDAEAVRCDGRALTYAQFDAEANALARLLISRGVAPGDKVGLLLERTERIPIAVVAILKTGAAYVPIDPSWPAARVELVLADCRPQLVVTESGLRHVVAGYEAPTIELDAVASAPAPASAPDIDVRPDDTAYVIYTSGSTGRPKGVEVSHHNATRLFSATDELYEFNSGDRWSMFHSIAFDVSVYEIWGALLHGACIVVVPYLVSRNPAAFRELLAKERVTVLSQTPSAFRLVRDADAEVDLRDSPLSLRYVIFAGEMLTFADLIPWVERHGDDRPHLINMYGITETTVHVTFRRLSRAEIIEARSSNVGRPMPDLECLLIDAEGHLVPYGVAGEICVGGPGVAKGYFERPELTAKRFVPHPFRPGETMYRSGDSARRLANGDIEYLGRLDHQVKLRGFRIELGEVETAVLSLDGVTACYAMVRTDGEDPQLVAYIVTRDGQQRPLPQTRRALSSRLPDYMLPSAVITLESLPLTVNGKINRALLPSPKEVQAGEGAVADDGAGTIADGKTVRIDLNTTMRIDRDATMRIVKRPPSGIGPVVEKICRIVAGVLQLSSVDPDDNFFDIGGDSMMAVKISAKAKALGLSISVQDVFQRQTPAELAAGLIPTQQPGEPAKIERRARRLLVPEGSEGALPAGVQDAYPLSALQAGMLFHSRVDGPGVYHDVFSYLVAAPWDETSFRSALFDVAERHPILRTTFELSAYSVPLQLVRESADVSLRVVDISGLAEAEQDDVLTEWMATEAGRPFDWRARTPLDFVVHVRDEDRFELSLSFHHALLDGWSVMELQRELLAGYDALRTTGQPLAVKPPQTRFRDFVTLERDAEGSPSRAFWHQQLHGVTPRLFAAVRSGPSRLSVTYRQLPDSFEPQLRKVARRRRASIKTALLVAHMVVMGRMAATDDVVTGLVVNGRPETEDSSSVLGMFLNTIPLRARLAAPHLAGLLDVVFAAENRGIPHRRVPLRTIQRDGGIGNLFDTAFNYVDLDVAATDDAESERSTVLRRNLIEHTNLPLVTVFSREVGALGIGLEFDPRVVSAEKVEAIVDAYQEVLDALAEGGAAPLPHFAEETELVCLHPSRRVGPPRAADAHRAARAQLGRIWQDVLGRPVGFDDSLRDSGGDSIQALVVSERIAAAFGCTPPLQELLHGATVDRLAYWLARPQSGSSGVPAATGGG